MIFTAMFAQRPLQTFYPAISAKQGVSPALASLPLFLHMFIQGVSGYFVGRLRHLLYRVGPLVAIQGAAGGVFLLLWRFPSYALSVVGISALGVWAGFAYFCAVYYASNAGHRARNIGVNEFLVGLASFASLFICEWFMKRTGSVPVMYAVCGAALVISTVAQWGVASFVKARRRANST